MQIALPSTIFHSLAEASRSTGFPGFTRYLNLARDRKALEFYWSGLKARLHSHRYALWTLRYAGSWLFLQDSSKYSREANEWTLSNQIGVYAAHVYRIDLRTGKVKYYGFGEEGSDAYKLDNPRWREGLAGK